MTTSHCLFSKTSNCISQERTNVNLLLLLSSRLWPLPIKKEREREESSLFLQRSKLALSESELAFAFLVKSLLSLESQESKVERPFTSYEQWLSQTRIPLPWYSSILWLMAQILDLPILPLPVGFSASMITVTSLAMRTTVYRTSPHP